MTERGPMPDMSAPAERGATDERRANGHFGDLLHARVSDLNAPLCVGLDPVLDRLPKAVKGRHPDAESALREFSIGVVETVADLVPLVKVQAACFERFGSAGVRVMEDVIARARALGLLVLLDAKRGDIGISLEHYGASAANMGAQAITASPYLGVQTLESLIKQDLGVFALVRTSNDEGDSLQRAKLEDGRMVCEMIADDVASLASQHTGSSGMSLVGAVVGATKGREATSLRKRLEHCPILAPGFGAQGGKIEALAKLCVSDAKTAGDLGLIVTASRSILYPGDATDWRQAIRDATIETTGRLREGLGLSS